MLVVGTTPDYIQWIRVHRPGEALFLTDPGLREEAREPRPDPWEECLAPPQDPLRAMEALRDHLERTGLRPSGVVCYDCPSLDGAAFLARRLGLPFPSPGSVRLCRDKGRSKGLWRRRGIPCPRAFPLPSPEALEAFLRRPGPWVLKPLRGTGSERVFLCGSPEEARDAWERIRKGRPREEILGEEVLRGREHSCDFRILPGEVRILRLTRKVPRPEGPFGSTLGYLLPPSPPPETEALQVLLRRGAAALGLRRGLACADLFLGPQGWALLELSPRPGGDCLPPLLRVARGWDPILAALEEARGRPLDPEPPREEGTFLGLRLLASQGGILKRLEGRALEEDPRVRELVWIREPGHRIVLPPEDPDSWVLGHAVARLDEGRDPDLQARELARSWTGEVTP